MAAPPRPAPPATFGLASQLRTPPLDAGSFSPGTVDSGPTMHKSPQKVTPAMRDDPHSGNSPRLFTMPQWGAKESPKTSSADGHSMSSPRSAVSDGRGGMDEQTWQAVRSEGAGARGYPVPPAVSKGLHARTKSSPQNGTNRFPAVSPHRPPRPDSPQNAQKVPPLPPPVPRPTETTATGAPIFNRVDFNFGSGQPLDLGIKLDPVYSTYKASKSTPNVSSPSKSEEDPGTPYAAQVRVSVAQRVERAPSFRKGSLAELSLDGHRRGSMATTNSSRSSLVGPNANEGGLTAPQPRPPRASSPGGTARPIGQGLRSSYAGSTTSSNGGAAPIVFRRASSVYVPNTPNTVAAPLPAPGASSIVPQPGQTPQSAILPGSKLPLNLLTLARRTAHISDTPGYAWRLNLLEKLELIMGSFLTVADAEAILSIGNGPEKRKSNRSESRKSQIGMPTSSSFEMPASSKRKSKPAEPKTFFGRMKRALSNPGVHVPKETPPPLPTSKKAVFGTPFAQVAEYGFVTSMIAGQRHDLPGVTFSTVEEIYRRGQGTKVPGLMQLHGEPGRVAKLVQIYDTPPDYGEHHDLSIESIHNVTSLLKRYLRDLPEPVLDQRLWRLYLAACVDSQNPLKSRIACAQIILRLLPTPNFSLLVYLVAFLSQMPLFPENKLSLESVAGIFGSSIMAPRPAMETKKPGKGEMVITGPTESFETIGQNIKKGQEALLWLLDHWSSVADGLLEPDFDIDPSTILDKQQPAPTLNVEVPGATLNITNKQAPAIPPPPPQQPLQSYDADVTEELRSWAPQSKPLSPPMEQRTLEISSVEQFGDVRSSYDSPGASPLINGVNSLQPPRSPLHDRQAPASPTSTRSNRSPLVQQNERTPRPDDAPTPKSPSVYEDSGPPTPQKEIPLPFFAAQHQQRQQQLRREQEEADEREEQLERGMPPPVPTADDDEESPSNTSEPPHMSASSSASSDRSASIITPKEHQLADSNGFRKSVEGTQEDYRLSNGPNHSVLDDLLDYDDNTSVYSFPSPPLTLPTRPSPFLAPSPFLTQEEIQAASSAQHARELDSLPPPVNPADYADSATPLPAGRTVKAAPVLEEKLVNHRTLPSTSDESTPAANDKALVRTSYSLVHPASSFSTPTMSSVHGHADEEADDEEEQPEDEVVAALRERDREEEEQGEDTSDLPSARPPVPLKSPKKARDSTASLSSPTLADSTPTPAAAAAPAPPLAHPQPRRALSPVNAADFEPKRAALPSADSPGTVPAALLQSKDDQLRSAHEAAERARKEVQGLWAKLTDLELERAEERKEMGQLRSEVEGFKERMTKRLSRGMNEQEKKKLEAAEREAREAREERERRDDELRRVKADGELLRQEAQHARDEAARAHEEVGEVRALLKGVEEARRKEQDDARATIEALEAQLGSIRAVLLGGLGGAGIKI